MKKLFLLNLILSGMMLISCSDEKTSTVKSDDVTIDTTSQEVDISTSEKVETVSIREVYEKGIALQNSQESQETYSFIGTVTCKLTNSFYLQDDTGAIKVSYPKDDVATLSSKVLVTSTITNYNGSVETVREKAEVKALGEGDKIEPLIIETVDDMTVDKQSSLVSLSNLQYVSGKASIGTSTLKFSLKGDEIVVKTDKNLDTDELTKIAESLSDLKTGDIVSLDRQILDWNSNGSIKLVNSSGIEVKKDETIYPTEIQVEKDEIEIEVGEVLELNASILPLNCTNPKLIYTSNEPNIVAVQDDNSIKGLKTGQATITIMCDADNSITKDVKVTVKGSQVITQEGLYCKITTESISNTITSTSAISDPALLLSALTITGNSVESISDMRNVYPAASGGSASKGNKFSINNIIKIGKSGSGEYGTISFNFPTGTEINKVVVEGCGWESRNELICNGVSLNYQQNITDNGENTVPIAKTYEFTESCCKLEFMTNRGITSGNHGFIIYSIEVYAMM